MEKKIVDEIERRKYEEILPSLIIQDLDNRDLMAAREKFNLIKNIYQISRIVQEAYRRNANNLDLLANLATNSDARKQALTYRYLIDEIKKQGHYSNILRLIQEIRHNSNLIKGADSLIYELTTFNVNLLTSFMKNSRKNEFANLCATLHSTSKEDFVEILTRVVDEAHGQAYNKNFVYLISNSNTKINDIGREILTNKIKNSDNLRQDQMQLADLLQDTKLSDLSYLLDESVKNLVFGANVCIKNGDTNEYVYAPSDFYKTDVDRRNSFTWRPKTKAGPEGTWTFEKQSDGSYAIKNRYRNEYLFVAADNYSFPSGERRVFTWAPGNQVSNGYWIIKPFGKGVSIYNTEHQKYLSTGIPFDLDRNHVYGSNKADHWIIEEC